MRILCTGVLLLSVCATARIAAAQTMQWTDKGYVSADLGGQVVPQTVNTSSVFSIYGENATVTSTAKSNGSVLFDLGGAYRVWGHNLLAGAFFARASSNPNAVVAGSIPDPLIFGQLRSVTSTLSKAHHAENVVDLDAIWMMPMMEKLDVGAFAGPSIFFIKQATLGSVSVVEPTPTIVTTQGSTSRTAAGFNIGADAQYMMWHKWGLGGTARFDWGLVRIGGSRTRLGGLQLSGGVRYRF